MYKYAYVSVRKLHFIIIGYCVSTMYLSFPSHSAQKHHHCTSANYTFQVSYVRNNPEKWPLNVEITNVTTYYSNYYFFTMLSFGPRGADLYQKLQVSCILAEIFQICLSFPACRRGLQHPPTPILPFTIHMKHMFTVRYTTESQKSCNITSQDLKIRNTSNSVELIFLAK